MSKVDPRLAMLLAMPDWAKDDEGADSILIREHLRFDLPESSSKSWVHLRTTLDQQYFQRLLSEMSDIEVGTPFDDITSIRATSKSIEELLTAHEHALSVVPTLSILAQFRGSSSLFESHLRSLGLEVGSVSGDVATLVGPKHLIAALQSDERVVFMEAARVVSRRGWSEVAEGTPAGLHAKGPAVEVGADLLHRATVPVTGAGVVIGIIDEDGIDFYHDDLRDERGTRIARLWDQRKRREYTAEDIDRDIESGAPYSHVEHLPDVSHFNHATAMACIAAGNGRASRGVLTGVAPAAEIVYVNVGASGPRAVSDMRDVADAIRYVFKYAGHRPCAVVMSLGDGLGPHDGTSLVERAIDDEVRRPNRAVVLAAGNNNLAKLHVWGVVPADGDQRLDLVFKVGKNVFLGEAFQIWYDGDDRLDVQITDPEGATLDRPIQPGSNEGDLEVGTARVRIVSQVRTPNNGQNVIEILIEPKGGTALRCTSWTITLSRRKDALTPTGPQPLHAWIDGTTAPHGGMRGVLWKTSQVDFMSVVSPGTAEGALTVGGYEPLLTRQVYEGSGRGPTRDGRKKPDLLAPNSTRVAPAQDRSQAVARPEPISMMGTSVAAPHVAGLVALLFELHRESGMSAASLEQELAEIALPSGAMVWARGEREQDNHAGWGCACAPQPRSAASDPRSKLTD